MGKLRGQMNVKIDTSCFHIGSVVGVSTFEVQSHLHEVGIIMRFSSMILARMTSQREDASDECMGIGRSSDECEDHLMQLAARCLTGTLGEDPLVVEEFTRKSLCDLAVANWNLSHHRN